MSVLRRQPQGFEGLRVVPEVLHAEQPATAHCEDARCLDVGPRAMTCATPDEPHDNPVVNIDEVADQFMSSASQVSRICSHWRITAS